jgi:hypothetical protein
MGRSSLGSDARRAATRHARAEREAIRQVYRWGFLLRAVVGIAAYGLTLYTNVAFLEDALFYEEVGHGVATDWLEGRSVDFDTLPQGARLAWLMIVLVAGAYFALGGLRVLPVLLVMYSAVTALVPVYVYRIARELGCSAAAAKRAGWLVALSPAFVFWSGSLHKEGPIMLLLSVCVYHMLRLQSKWRGRSVLLVLGSLAALTAMRFYLAILMALVAAVGLVMVRGRGVSPTIRRVQVPALARKVLVAALVVGLMGAVAIRESSQWRLTESPAGMLVQLDSDRQWLVTSAESGYLPEAELSTPAEAARFLPVGLLYFLTVPFPWQFGSLRQNLVIPETLFWVLGMYPLIALGIARGLRVNRPGTVVLVAATGGMCLLYALVSGNVGIAYRMRSQIWLLWAPFAAWGWELWRERRQRKSVRPSRGRPVRRVPVTR